MSELNLLSAVSMAEKIRSKKLSPVELVEAHLSRIERLNPQLNAFVQVDGERARRDAGAAESRVKRGEKLGPLHGVPISIKSSIEVEGLRCEAGTKLRAGYVASQDAPLVARLRAAGAIVLGVTNCPELLMAWETDNLLYGRTNNPWDVSRTPGGSSGGEAAAIASGCSAGGVGSDGGGSIRVPAHFSGICGLKPTPGRIPATGHFPVSVGPFALLGVVGPMARTIADLKVLFEVMQGPDDGDPSAVPVSVRWPAVADLKKVRVGYFEDDGRTPVTPGTRAAIRAAAQALQRAGFQVEAFRPDGLEASRQLWWKLFGVAGGMLLGPMTRMHEGELTPILREFSGWVAEEKPHTAQTLLDTWIERDMVRMQVFRQMREFPVLLCPVAAVPAFRHGERSWTIDGQTVKYLDAWSYTEWFNLLGVPAVAVPMGKSAEGLPIGVQVAGLPWQEEVVLSVAEELEAQRGEWQAPLIGSA
ncbi:MAG TPA: amidase [Terriglobales bacterium]|jgi:Asp-tRNA(Asn)/Glu-tRNA(Gln) amidotransferase A subunit family amidase|nr:amidase [Terriglobales bacterium]